MDGSANVGAGALLSGIAIFLSSVLLFLLELMIAKMVLPYFGGAPTVWTTCMLFFQGMLLLGYLFAHFVAQSRSSYRNLYYPVLLAFSLFCLSPELPKQLSANWNTAATIRLLFMLFTTAAVPAFLLSAASPLIQKWRAGFSDEPYYLFGLSNAGSLGALVAYPFLIEPNLPRSAQLTAWTALYLIFGLIVSALSYLTSAAAPSASSSVTVDEEMSRSTKFQIVLLSFIPSSLMLGVTHHLTLDVAAFPLLWMFPLATYLLSLVIAFSSWTSSIIPLCKLLFPVAVCVPVILLAVTNTYNLGVQLLLHLVPLLIIGVVCHAKIFALRPLTDKLTVFYLLLAIGGVVGGIFNAIISPAIFNDLCEYPLVIVLASYFAWPSKTDKSGLPSINDLLVAILAGSLLFAAVPLSYRFSNDLFPLGVTSLQLLQLLFSIIVCAVSIRCRSRMTLVLSVLAAVLLFGVVPSESVVAKFRTFFGVLRVESSGSAMGEWRQLRNGTTLHGMQFVNEPLSRIPTTFYANLSPVDEVLHDERVLRDFKRFAVVGLGAGTLAAYGESGQQMTFYEINPAVKEVATDPRYFSYLKQSKADVQIEIGDARLKMNDAPDGKYDLIALDAFSSDAIPVHLLTKEALQLYLRKLQPQGLLLLHVTNWYVELTPLIASEARELSLVGIVREDYEVTPETRAQGKWPSKWIVLARDPALIANLGARQGWNSLPAKDLPAPWNDDYSDVLAVFRNRLF